MDGGAAHLTITGGNDDDGAVHVGSPCDHILNVIGVAGAVDVGVVAGVGGVFDVGGGNGDAAFSLLRGFVDGAIFEVGGKAFLSLSLGDGGCQSSLVVSAWMSRSKSHWRGGVPCRDRRGQ